MAKTEFETLEKQQESQEEVYRTAAEGMGFGEPSTVYAEEEWEQQKVKAWPRQIHVFGVRQNQVNRGTAARLRTLEVENRTLKLKIEQLEKELESAHVREKKSLGRVAVLLDKMQAEVDRLRLSAQLNSNAIDRIMKQEQNIAPSEETNESETTDIRKND